MKELTSEHLWDVWTRIEDGRRTTLDERIAICRMAAKYLELKQDAERMDWLDKIELIGIDHIGYGEYRIYAGVGFPSIREAIDASREQKNV